MSAFADFRRSRALAAAIAGVAHAAILAAVPLACGVALHRQSGLLIAILGIAAAVEFHLSRLDQGDVPPLARASAIALLVLFWITLAGRGGNALSVTVGVASMTIGIALRAIAIVTLGRRFTSAHRADGHLASHGVYAWIRHPSETGQLALGLGAAVLTSSPAAALWWTLVVLPLTLARLRREEAALDATSGYRHYRADVPGLLPWRVGAALRRHRRSATADP